MQPTIENNNPSTDPVVAPEQSATPVQAPASPQEPAPNPEQEPAPALASTQEPVKTKNKKPFIVVMIILIIILIAVGGFVFAKFFPFGQTDQPSGDSVSGSSEQTQNNYDLSAMSDFDLAFLRLQSEGENVIYSPLSIKYALAMLSDAADGESKTQITNLIGNYQPKNYINNANRSLANAMFIREGRKADILDSYTTTLQQKYNASVIFDSFANANTVNQWISDETMGIIQNMLTDDDLTSADFALVNALAIDMNWNNQLQCASAPDKEVPCEFYAVKFAHENYHEYIRDAGGSEFDEIDFNGTDIKAAEIGASANNYNIVEELGEDYIRSTVLDAYEEWKENNGEDDDFDIDKYVEQLNGTYGIIRTSTDFYFSDNDNEKVFAKDLKTYDDSTLQYVGIMPKNKNLSSYIETLDIEYLTGLLNNMKESSDINNYKDGVVTRIKGHIPFFNFSYSLKLSNALKELGVTDVFDEDVANLSNLTSIEHSHITSALHKADIDFSNDGIKAAAATVLVGGLGAGYSFDYEWDVPVEDIDLTFDQPFFFIIRDKSSGEVWFTGAVYQLSE